MTDLEMELKEQLTVKQRILSHLSRYSLIVEQAMAYEILPVQVCQDGIAEAIGVSRAHAALRLSDLEEEGVIGARLGHIKGYHRRKKVYFLNERGDYELR